MRGLKWIGAWSEQHLKDEIENLLPDNDVVFIEFEYYSVLTRMIKVLKNLNYITDLFEAEWDKFLDIQMKNIIWKFKQKINIIHFVIMLINIVLLKKMKKQTLILCL